MILTPAQISDLRASTRWRVNEPTSLRARIIWSGDGPVLTYDGRIVAQGELALLAECLRQEAAEPGFIPRILDVGQPVDVAGLDPAGYRAAASRRAAEAATARQIAEEAAEARRRRAHQLDISKLELDDL